MNMFLVWCNEKCAGTQRCDISTTKVTDKCCTYAWMILGYEDCRKNVIVCLHWGVKTRRDLSLKRYTVTTTISKENIIICNFYNKQRFCKEDYSNYFNNNWISQKYSFSFGWRKVNFVFLWVWTSQWRNAFTDFNISFNP